MLGVTTQKATTSTEAGTTTTTASPEAMTTTATTPTDEDPCGLKDTYLSGYPDEKKMEFVSVLEVYTNNLPQICCREMSKLLSCLNQEGSKQSYFFYKECVFFLIRHLT